MYTTYWVWESIMDCKEVQHMIPGFLDDELEVRPLESFLNHIEECKSCKEELTIQFLVEVGTRRLEDGNNFNLSEELNLMMRDSFQRLRSRKRILKAALFLRILVVIELVITVVLAFVL